MSAARELEQGSPIDQALQELQRIVRHHYPEATFDVTPAPDDQGAFDLLAFIAIEDTDEVMDVVIDRLLEMQVDQGLPVRVVPLRPLRDAPR